jgi:hypothetical protein
MVPGHPSRSALSLSTPPITSSRISAQPTTRHCLREEGGGRGTTSSQTTTRAANELSPPKSAYAGDAASAPAPGAQSTWDCALGYRRQHEKNSVPQWGAESAPARLCPLQAGTGHGRPGRAPGRCGCAVTSLLQRGCGGAVC